MGAMLRGAAAFRGDGERGEEISVLVVDDHPVVCEGLGHLIASDHRLRVVGSASTARGAIDAARTSKPDVILLDLRLPDMLAADAIPLLRAAAPRTSIILFTAHAGHAGIRAAQNAGAQGILLKDASDVDLVGAIIRVAQGERVVDARVSQSYQPFGSKQLLGPQLTVREYQVLRRVAIGETNGEIATVMRLAPNTVKFYLQTTMRKLGAHNRVEALAKAAQYGLL